MFFDETKCDHNANMYFEELKLTDKECEVRAYENFAMA
jgi:hypothetical protein